MDSNKINTFLAMYSKYFSPQQLMDLRNRMQCLPSNAEDLIYMVELKNPTTAWLISFFIGELGIDRFYIGDIGLGIGKLMTCGACCIWWFVDLFLIMDATREKNYQSMLLALSQYV